MDINTATPLCLVYNNFLSKITDDLYLELTKEDTMRDCEDIFVNAVPNFEFPRFSVFDYLLEDYIDEAGVPKRGFYNFKISKEEIDILSDLMMIEWLRRQIASVENTRMKYSGSDFKFTSQANHLDKLLKTKTTFDATNRHKQRLYKRRKIDSTSGAITPNWSGLAGGAINGYK